MIFQLPWWVKIIIGLVAFLFIAGIYVAIAEWCRCLRKKMVVPTTEKWRRVLVKFVIPFALLAGVIILAGDYVLSILGPTRERRKPRS